MTRKNNSTNMPLVKYDLHLKVRLSFLKLISYSLALSEQDLSSIEEYDAIYTHIQAMVSSLENNAATDTDSAALSTYHDQVLNALKRLNVLRSYFDFNIFWIKQTFSCCIAKQTITRLDDANTLFLRHLEALTSEQSNYKSSFQPYMLGIYMARIPLRMTKANYHAYIKAALESKVLEEGCLTDFRQIFYPLHIVEKTTGFEKIKQTLDEIWYAENEFAASDEFIPVMEASITANNLLNDACAQMHTLYCAINALRIVKECGADILTTDEEAAALYQKFLSNTDREGVKAQLAQMRTTTLKNLPFKNKQDSLPTDWDDSLSPEEAALLGEQWMRIQRLYVELDSAAIDDLVQINSAIDSRSINTPKFWEDFQRYMDQSVASQSAKRKRFIRQQFLSALPYPYTLKEYKDYFISTYNSLSDDERAQMIVQILPMETEEGEDDADSDF